MANTTFLNLPLLASDQSQKHVTVNEALTDIDTRFGQWLGVAPKTIAIASGTLTITGSIVIVDPESGTSDTLSAISGGQDGDILILAGSTGNTITVTAGTLRAASRDLSSATDILVLLHIAGGWVEVAYSV